MDYIEKADLFRLANAAERIAEALEVSNKDAA